MSSISLWGEYFSQQHIYPSRSCSLWPPSDSAGAGRQVCAGGCGPQSLCPPPPPRSQCLQTLKGLPGSCRDVWRGRVMCGEALLRPFGWSTYSTRMLLTRNVPASSHHTQKLQVMAPQQICVELIYSFWSRCSLQVRGLIVAEIIRSKKPNFYIVCINMLILKK